MFVTVLLGFTVALLFLFTWYRKSHMNVFKSLGIPGPKPHWFFGNLHDNIQNQGFENYIAWTKKYGQLFGYYEGPAPILVTSDPDMVKEVFIKRFSHFHGRKPHALGPNAEKAKSVHMFVAYGQRWKRLRSIINPTFSTAKLKLVVPLVANKIDVLISKLQTYAASDKAVDITQDFRQFTIDVIGEVAFGLDINSQENSEEPFLKHAKALFKSASAQKRPFLVSIGLYIPELRPFLVAMLGMIIPYINIFPMNVLRESVRKVINIRRGQSDARKDILQLMLDAEVKHEQDVSLLEMKATEEIEEIHGEVTSAESSPSLPKENQTRRRLTNEEVEMQAVIFLLAGYDTTSNLLSYLAYVLACNPDKQKKLQEEIETADLSQTQSELFKTLNRMEYLQMVINETLRLYPIGAPVVNRMCMQSCTVNGVDIPEGMVVQTNAMMMHNDPQLWGPTDPAIFEPERFSKEACARRPDTAFIPFGVGPRNCVGMRFALMETKLTLVKILQKFTIVRCGQTQVPLQLVEEATITPKDGVFVRFTHKL